MYPAGDRTSVPRSTIVIDGYQLRVDVTNVGPVEFPIASGDQLMVLAMPDAMADCTLLRVEMRINDDPRRVGYYLDAVRRAWHVARRDDASPTEVDEPAGVIPLPLPAEVPAEPVEPPKVVRGPDLVADDPEWLMLAPLADTRRLARGELLVTGGPPPGGETE